MLEVAEQGFFLASFHGLPNKTEQSLNVVYKTRMCMYACVLVYSYMATTHEVIPKKHFLSMSTYFIFKLLYSTVTHGGYYSTVHT